MPIIQLPNNQSAVIASRDEISERTTRSISRAYLSAASVAAHLASLGFDDTKPETWGEYSTLSDDQVKAMDAYQAELIVGLVKQWTLGDLPTLESVLDLPKATFDVLAESCGNEFNNSGINTEPDIDPKAPIAGSQN